MLIAILITKDAITPQSDTRGLRRRMALLMYDVSSIISYTYYAKSYTYIYIYIYTHTHTSYPDLEAGLRCAAAEVGDGPSRVPDAAGPEKSAVLDFRRVRF